jgi:penicillin G amidase
MNKYLKNTTGIIIIIIPLLILIGFFFNSLSKKSFYPTEGIVKVPSLEAPVKVYFDDFGVPQIIAGNEDDAYFILGYMHARDRLWQMDLARRLAEGRLSEIFGSGVMNFDKLFRTIGISRFCYSWYNELSPKSKKILDSYVKGVNTFIESHYDNLPVEFDALNYKPEPWKPENSLMITRLMGWDLNIAWYSDYVLGEIVNKTGLEKTSEMFPDTNIVLFKKPVIEEDSTETDKDKIHGEKLKQISVLGKGFFDFNEEYRKFFNINGSHVGSNAWVISGEKTETGKPFLANDPHLGLQAPSKWYEAYIKGGELDVHGMTIAGVPGVVIGSNKNISWGLTNLMNDDNDFIILKKDSINQKKYIYRNQSYFLDSIVEKIYVKDSDEVSYTVRISKTGPVISDLIVRGFADLKEKANNLYKDKLLTFKWTGFETSDEISCFNKINTAKNWEDFKSGLKDFNTPAMNFVYADVNGNIGYHAAGKIPIRKTDDFKNYLYPAGSDVEWTGFVDFDRLPNTFNPKEGFIVSANTNPFDWMNVPLKDRYYISYLWESSSRFDRIHEFLTSHGSFDLEDFKLIQNSYESPLAKSIGKRISEAFKNKPSADNNIKWCTERFAGWNGEMNPDESIGSVYNVFLIYLLKNTYEDEMGPEVLHDFFVIQNMPYRSIQLLLKDSNSVWFDNINTKAVETRDEIIRKSLTEAIEYLKTRFENQDINTWHWGVLHKIKFRHPLGMVEALDKAFNIGPFEIGGDQTTPNNTEYQFNDFLESGNFNTIVGPSMRFIINMADIEHSYTINTTGQSGQPIHTNYKDQSRMWLYGEYRTNSTNESEMLKKEYDLLILNPSN